MKPEHLIGGLLLVVLAYNAGKNKASQASAQAPFNAVDSPAQWWTFAGMWGA